MATVLLIVIFMGYIGLGIPDSLFGAAWPAIYGEFNLPISYANFVTTIVSLGTIASSFFSSRVVSRFGTAKVAAVSTAMTATALLGFSLSPNIIWLCLFAIPSGLGAGSVDAALNNYVALNYKATHMNFLHCFYGVGVSLSPYLMSLSLTNSNDWRTGYKNVFYIQLAITAVMIISLPLWKKVGEKKAEEDVAQKILKFRDIIKIPATRASIGIFMASCGIESICLVWGSSFLVESKGLTADEAAGLITLYFVGLALGRFVSGLLANKLSAKALIIAGEVILLAAVILLFVPSNTYITVAGMFLIGFGNGPVFPNMTHLTPLTFGKEVSQSIIGTQMAMAYVSILLLPIAFGQLAEHLSMGLFPIVQAVLFVATAIPTFMMFKGTKK
ncbi:MAG: MFS transporter [Clostridia bacterium]|nr:MFS transporter [Clostridia bacterium]